MVLQSWKSRNDSTLRAEVKSKVLVHMGSTDFINGFIGKFRKLRAITDDVHEGAGLDVQNFPAITTFGASDVQAEAVLCFGVWL